MIPDLPTAPVIDAASQWLELRTKSIEKELCYVFDISINLRLLCVGNMNMA